MAPPRKAKPKEPQVEALDASNAQDNNGPNSPYFVVPQYGGTDNAAPTTFIMPPNISWPQQGQAGQAVVIQMLRVDGPNASAGSQPCAITAGTGDNQDFSLAWSTGTSGGGILATVTVSPDNLWKTAPEARQTLRASFDAFKQQLETLELNAGCLTRAAAAYIWQTVASLLPLPISETLYYRYGFDPVNRYVDLLPGMRLRVEWGDYQFVSPTQPGAALNGMAGQGSSVYEICRVTDSQGNQRVAFDAFLGSMIPPPSVASSKAGLGSLIDLQGSGMARRYYRLFYPANIPSSDSQGSASIVQNVTLIGADTLADLYTATQSYTSSGACAQAASGNLPILCNFFRGRVIAIPEVCIMLQSHLVYVPLGTTVRNLVDRLVLCNLPVFNPPTNFNQVIPIYNRFYGPMPNYVSKNSNYWQTVTFNTLTGNKLPAGSDVYDLPVVQWDRLQMNT